MSRQKELLQQLLFNKGASARLVTAWFALFAGVSLLLLTIILWAGFRTLLAPDSHNESLGSSFLTINRQIGADTKQAGFSEADINELRHAPQVEDAGPVLPAHFQAYISLGGALGFSTLVPLEAAPDRFLDKVPDGWAWQDGSLEVPLIIPTEFINQYNFAFAPSQGLPYLSQNALKALGFDLTVGEEPRNVKFRGHIAGFSDRINSILVPASFLETYNQRLGKKNQLPARVVVRMKDPSDPAFARFLESHHYTTNAEQLRQQKLRHLVDVVTAITAGLALLLIGLSAMIFILFIELTITRAGESLRLLGMIGYSPGYLRRYVSARFLPILLSALLVSVGIGLIAQVAAYSFAKKLDLHLPLVPGWPFWVAVVAAAALLTFQVRVTIGKALSKL